MAAFNHTDIFINCWIGKIAQPREFFFVNLAVLIFRIMPVKNTGDEIPEMPDVEWETDHYIYKLGPAIVPGKTVKTGKIFKNGRVWAMLDTLLTCDTISDARDLTQSRLG